MEKKQSESEGLTLAQKIVANEEKAARLARLKQEQEDAALAKKLAQQP